VLCCSPPSFFLSKSLLPPTGFSKSFWVGSGRCPRFPPGIFPTRLTCPAVCDHDFFSTCCFFLLGPPFRHNLFQVKQEFISGEVLCFYASSLLKAVFFVALNPLLDHVLWSSFFDSPSFFKAVWIPARRPPFPSLRAGPLIGRVFPSVLRIINIFPSFCFYWILFCGVPDRDWQIISSTPFFVRLLQSPWFLLSHQLSFL